MSTDGKKLIDVYRLCRHFVKCFFAYRIYLWKTVRFVLFMLIYLSEKTVISLGCHFLFFYRLIWFDRGERGNVG